MSLKDPELLEFIAKMFARNGCDFSKLLQNLDPLQQEKLKELAHFYYYICTPEQIDAREELQLVGITSLIEAMMQEIPFQDPFNFFKTKYKGQKGVEDFEEFRNAYLNEHGAAKKVKAYFAKYLSPDDQNILLNSVERFSIEESDFKSLSNIEDVAKVFYDMRSEFVHSADMPGFCPKHCIAAGIFAGGRHYTITIGIENILGIFERSFINYWEEKAICN